MAFKGPVHPWDTFVADLEYPVGSEPGGALSRSVASPTLPSGVRSRKGGDRHFQNSLQNTQIANVSLRLPTGYRNKGAPKNRLSIPNHAAGQASSVSYPAIHSSIRPRGLSFLSRSVGVGGFGR